PSGGGAGWGWGVGSPHPPTPRRGVGGGEKPAEENPAGNIRQGETTAPHPESHRTQKAREMSTYREPWKKPPKWSNGRTACPATGERARSRWLVSAFPVECLPGSAPLLRRLAQRPVPPQGERRP
ncbi:hypothetical protein EST54_33875, partial [Streptomyces sioyaensis]